MAEAILDYAISMKYLIFEREVNLFNQIHPLHPFVMFSTHQVNYYYYYYYYYCYYYYMMMIIIAVGVF